MKEKLYCPIQPDTIGETLYINGAALYHPKGRTIAETLEINHRAFREPSGLYKGDPIRPWGRKTERCNARPVEQLDSEKLNAARSLSKYICKRIERPLRGAAYGEPKTGDHLKKAPKCRAITLSKTDKEEIEGTTISTLAEHGFFKSGEVLYGVAHDGSTTRFPKMSGPALESRFFVGS